MVQKENMQPSLKRAGYLIGLKNILITKKDSKFVYLHGAIS